MNEGEEEEGAMVVTNQVEEMELGNKQQHDLVVADISGGEMGENESIVPGRGVCHR